MRKFGKRAAVAAAVVSVLGAGSRSWGTTRSYIGPLGGDWNVSGNWSGGAVPGLGDAAILGPSGTGTYTINSGTYTNLHGLTSFTLGVGTQGSVQSSPTLFLRGGTFISSSDFLDTGDFNQSGGFNQAGTCDLGMNGLAATYEAGEGTTSIINLNIGYGGRGTFSQSSGLTTLGTLSMGLSNGTLNGSGTLIINGGTLDVLGFTQVGQLGASSIIQNGSDAVTSLQDGLAVGDGAAGTLSVSQGSFSVGFTDIGVDTSGVYLQSGGSSSFGRVEVGVTVPPVIPFGSGTMSLTGGTMSATEVDVGESNGTGSMTTGTFLENGAAVVATIGTLSVSTQLGRGTAELSAGSLSVADAVIGVSGNGTFMQDGAAARSNFGTLLIGSGSFSTGTFTMSAGSMIASTTFVGYGSMGGTLTQSGGSSSFGQVVAGSSLGGQFDSSGTINLTGGSLTATTAAIGFDVSSGWLSQSGTQTFSKFGSLYVGLGEFTDGNVSVTAGTLIAGQTSVGNAGVGGLSQSGGTVSLGTCSIAVTDGGLPNYGGADLNLNGGYASAGPVTIGSAGTLSVGGSLAHVMSVNSAGNVVVGAGLLALTGNGSLGAGTLANLTIAASGATVDLGNAGLVIAYAPGQSPIGAMVSSAQEAVDRDGSGLPRWDHAGLTSGDAQADYNNNQATGVGVIDNQDYLSNLGESWNGAAFLGVAVSSDNVVLMRYTYYGDTDLDGIVDGTDVTDLQLGFTNGTQGDNWFFGDFNYDGQINGTDVSLLILGFISEGSEPVADAGMKDATDFDAITAAQARWLLSMERGLTPAEVARFESLVGVPEPIGAALGAVSAAGLLALRRRGALGPSRRNGFGGRRG